MSNPNPLTPPDYVARHEGLSPEPDSNTANRDLDGSPANASADMYDANPDKVSVNDITDADPLHDTASEAAYLPPSFESRLEAKLKAAWQQIRQQTDQIAAIQSETAKQAQIFQAKIAYLDRWYAAELHRMEQKLRGYVDTQIVGVHSAYSADSRNASPPKGDRPRPNQTTYVVPERPNVSRGSQSNKVPLFLLLLAVGLGVAHLLAAVIVTYTGSPSILTALGEMTVQQLLPAITAIIFVSGAITFVWELRKE
ncbi:MAG: hypothetical protein WBB01_21440 [Phormidesmis sp.]